MLHIEPEYIKLYKTGELNRRATLLHERLLACDICPRNCKVNRLIGERGYCHASYIPVVAAYCAHHGEEPPISGIQGSGTIFFGNCNMNCVYCQNYQISQYWKEQQLNEMTTSSLANIMVELQNDKHCHNINLVTPSHFVPQIVIALQEAISQGLRLPLVYNTSGYDGIATIKQLDGIVDIYLVDLRYAESNVARELSLAEDYVEKAREAIKEMYRQVGNLVTNEAGIAQRGIIVRHLILPNKLSGSEESLKWLTNEISPEIYLSIMSQYYPAYKANKIELLARPIKHDEYTEVIELLKVLNINNGWTQDINASDNYQPDFLCGDHPFEK